MYGDTKPDSEPRSLDAVSDGEVVRIERILFETLRADCAGVGLQEGDVLYCRGASTAYLVLETEAKQTVLLRRDWARFISTTAYRRPPADARRNSA